MVPGPPGLAMQTLVDAISLVDLLLGLAPLQPAPNEQKPTEPSWQGGSQPSLLASAMHQDQVQHPPTAPAKETVSQELQALLGLCNQLQQAGGQAGPNTASPQSSQPASSMEMAHQHVPVHQALCTRDSSRCDSAERDSKTKTPSVTAQVQPLPTQITTGMQGSALQTGYPCTAAPPVTATVVPPAHSTFHFEQQEQEQEQASSASALPPPRALHSAGRSSQPNLPSSVRDTLPTLLLPARGSVQHLPFGPGPPSPPQQGTNSGLQAKAGAVPGVPAPSRSSVFSTPPPLHAAGDTLEWRAHVSGLDEQGLRRWWVRLKGFWGEGRGGHASLHLHLHSCTYSLAYGFRHCCPPK
jgi:hypothetical protein